MRANPDLNATTLSDNEIVERILGGDRDLYQIIVRRYNRRLYRVTWAIVRDECEAEDVMQETYVRAYEHLTDSTWLIRIAIHEAWNRTKRRDRQCDMDATSTSVRNAGHLTQTPERDLLTIEARTVLEQAIDALPERLRSVFVLRFLEEMSTDEVAGCLGISEQAVKMRLFRARLTLRRALYDRARATSSKAFQFLGERCDRVTSRVLTRIAEVSQGSR
jgi:RNA polymerase sigma-70 factor (ECF subfamily)